MPARASIAAQERTQRARQAVEQPPDEGGPCGGAHVGQRRTKIGSQRITRKVDGACPARPGGFHRALEDRRIFGFGTGDDTITKGFDEFQLVVVDVFAMAGKAGHDDRAMAEFQRVADRTRAGMADDAGGGAQRTARNQS